MRKRAGVDRIYKGIGVYWMLDRVQNQKTGKALRLPDFSRLTDEMLIQAYERAVQLELEQDFITILQTEMMKRNLNP